METVIAAIGRKLPGADLMVAGDSNVDILAPEGRRVENIATDLVTAGVEDMAQHFMPRRRRWSRDRRTWDMWQKGQVVRSRTGYILGTDRRLFKNVAVRDSRHNTNHYMVLGCLPGAPLEATRQYQGGRKQWPVRPPAEPSRTDTLFAASRRAVPKPAPREARRNAWISAETWRLINERVSTRRDPRYGQADRWRLGKEIGKSLSKDRRRRTEEAGAEVEDLMKADPPLIQEAWHRLHLGLFTRSEET